jgi:NADH-ubiquinone oxidoreductase chain 1
LAETNRTPFDFPEAESELVAGFMTEHGASIFVFFFLGEYSSLILMSAFMTVFFLGGYHGLSFSNPFEFSSFFYIFRSSDHLMALSHFFEDITYFSSFYSTFDSIHFMIGNILSTLIFGIKTVLVSFLFI